MMKRKMRLSSSVTRWQGLIQRLTSSTQLSVSKRERTADMADQIASVDAGNGGTNAVLARPGGNHKTFYEPSVRAAASGDSLGLGKEWEIDYEYVDWNGHRYVTGDDVIRVTRRALERHMGINRYGNEFHQFL